MSKEIKKPETMPAYINSDTRRGSETIESEDVALPRVDVLQALSPQQKKTDPLYIPGAEEGMFFNPITEELYGASLVFIPVYFQKKYLVWKDRDQGGGFGGQFDTRTQADGEAVKRGPDWAAQDTHYQLGLLVHEYESLEEVVFSMSVSKMGASRSLNALIRIAGNDRFSRTYDVTAISATSPKGAYNKIKFSYKGFPTKKAYLAAESMYNSVCQGLRVVDVSDLDPSEQRPTFRASDVVFDEPPKQPPQPQKPA